MLSDLTSCSSNALWYRPLASTWVEPSFGCFDPFLLRVLIGTCSLLVGDSRQVLASKTILSIICISLLHYQDRRCKAILFPPGHHLYLVLPCRQFHLETGMFFWRR